MPTFIDQVYYWAWMNSSNSYTNYFSPHFLKYIKKLVLLEFKEARDDLKELCLADILVIILSSSVGSWFCLFPIK